MKKKHPQVFTQGRSVQNFSQIGRFLKSPACPKVFSLVLGLKLVTTPIKIKIFKKWKKHPQVFTQGRSVQNFSQIRPFLKSPGCSNVFSLVLGLKLVTTPLKIKLLKNEKKDPQGRSVQNFSQIERFLKSPARPKVFSLVLVLKVVTTPLIKNQNFEKNEKNTPRYSPKEEVCKISAKSNDFWSSSRRPFEVFSDLF